MILSCGEALIDMLPRTSTGGEACFAPYAGGAVMNTAIALARLGSASSFLTGLSSDLMGDVLRETLAASKVNLDHAVLSDRPTTLAFVKLTNGHASYFFYDENTAGRMMTPADMPALPRTITAYFTGGIWLAVEPCGTALEALMTREAAGRVTMIDPNVRPGFVRDRAAYTARIDRMIALSDIVKLSDEDSEWLYGRTDPQALLAKGAKVVLVTEGAKGATAYTARGSVQVAAPKITVADTVGAGDTFNAGFLASLDQNGLLTKAQVANLSDEALRAALTLGTRAAAITCSRPGANPPWAHEL
ncbi:MAG: carbohydrate kinase [Rhodobacterales bacterium]|nr:carbohydrate kinase [Rhodobacterales bacterium]